jgi:hypothetical protein
MFGFQEKFEYLIMTGEMANKNEETKAVEYLNHL